MPFGSDLQSGGPANRPSDAYLEENNGIEPSPITKRNSFRNCLRTIRPIFRYSISVTTSTGTVV